MPKHGADETNRLHVNPPASLELSNSHVACVAHLVGYRIAAIERELILQTLRSHRGNRTHTANVLGISVRSLRDKIHTYRDQGESVPKPGSSCPDYPTEYGPAGFRH